MQTAAPFSLVCAFLASVAISGAQEVSDTVLPRVIKEVQPVYPADLQEQKIEGEVWLECVVSVEGEPTEIKVKKGLHERLDAAAVVALKQWRFRPGTKHGEPVPTTITVEFTFKARKQGAETVGTDAAIAGPRTNTAAPRAAARARGSDQRAISAEASSSASRRTCRTCASRQAPGRLSPG